MALILERIYLLSSPRNAVIPNTRREEGRETIFSSGLPHCRRNISCHPSIASQYGKRRRLYFPTIPRQLFSSLSWIQLIVKCILPGTCDANDAVNITIVQPDEQKLKTVSSFHPQFTYPIFGDDETIFGYKGLIIRLRFAAHDLRPHLHTSYDEKFKPVEDIAAVDILKTLRPWISEGWYHPLILLRFFLMKTSTCRGLCHPPRLRKSRARG
jgi:histone acetyltransferase 1